MNPTLFQGFKVSQEVSMRTKKLLSIISERSSGRRGFTKYEYSLQVENCDEFQKLTFNPIISVYPSRYERSDSDRTDLITYVLTRYFLDFVIVDDNKLEIKIKPGTFAIGEYQYKLSEFHNGKQWRHWYKTK